MPSCDASWYGQCETDVTTYGGSSSMDLCHDGSNHYVSFKPGNGSGSNAGIGKAFLLDPLDRSVELIADIDVKAANSTVAMQVVFKNSAGVVVSTETKCKTFTAAGLAGMKVDFIVPSGAASAVASFGVTGTSSEIVAGLFQAFGKRKPDDTPVQDPPVGCATKAQQMYLVLKGQCEAAGGLFDPASYCEPVSDMSGECAVICVTSCQTTGSSFQESCSPLW